MTLKNKEVAKFEKRFAIEDPEVARFLAIHRHQTCTTWSVQPVETAGHVRLKYTKDDFPVGSLWTPAKGDGRRLEIDPQKSNIVSGACLIGYQESKEDALKRPTLEDVYLLKILHNIMADSEGSGVVWLPDNTFKMGLLEWAKGQAATDTSVVDDVTQVYLNFCKNMLPPNCQAHTMSDQPVLQDIEAKTTDLRNALDFFYRIPPHAITAKHREILHKYAATMAALAEGFVTDTSLPILAVCNADEKGTVKFANQMVEQRGKTNQVYLLSPFHIYGIGVDNDQRLGVRNSMFHSSPGYKLFVGDSEDVNIRKMQEAERLYPGITGSWKYLVGRAVRQPIKTDKDLADFMASMRRHR